MFRVIDTIRLFGNGFCNLCNLDEIPLAGPPDAAEICLGDTAFISIEPLDSVEWIWEGEKILFIRITRMKFMLFRQEASLILIR